LGIFSDPFHLVLKGFNHESIGSDFSSFGMGAHPPEGRRNGGEMEYFYGQLKVQAGRIIGWIDEEVIT
jgi:hypothetical protein